MTRIRLFRAGQQIGATRDETRLAVHSQIAGVEGRAVVRPVVSTGAVVFLTLFRVQFFTVLLPLRVRCAALGALLLFLAALAALLAALAVLATSATPVPVVLSSTGQRSDGCQRDAGTPRAAREAEHGAAIEMVRGTPHEGIKGLVVHGRLLRNKVDRHGRSKIVRIGTTRRVSLDHPERVAAAPRP